MGTGVGRGGLGVAVGVAVGVGVKVGMGGRGPVTTGGDAGSAWGPAARSTARKSIVTTSVSFAQPHRGFHGGRSDARCAPGSAASTAGGSEGEGAEAGKLVVEAPADAVGGRPVLSPLG